MASQKNRETLGRPGPPIHRAGPVSLTAALALLVALALGLTLAGCGETTGTNGTGSIANTGTDDSAGPAPPLATELDAGAVLVPIRSLAADVALGDPWTAAVIGPERLWTIAPDAEIDVDSEVFLRFTVGLSPGCRLGPPTSLAFDPDARRLHPVFTPSASDCRSGADPATFVVAVARRDVPKGDFTVWVGAEAPPPELAEGQATVSGGQLTAPDPGSGRFPELVEGGDIAVGETKIGYNLSTHCGLDFIFQVIGGTQWQLEGSGPAAGLVPVPWRSFIRGEEIDLELERVAVDRLDVTPLGSGRTLTFVPSTAETEIGCA